MARLRGVNVLNHTIRGHQAEDGYVAVGGDGYTVVNGVPFDSVFMNMKRTATGLWTATLREPYQCNLNYFNVVPQLYTGSNPSIVFFVLLVDTLGATTSTPWTLGAQSNPQTITWKFCNSSGTAEDLPANSGFKYEFGGQVSTAYYTKAY